MVRYDEFNALLPDRGLYLQRLGFDGRALPDGGEPTLDCLNALIFAHQTRIPFDALDSRDFGKPACLHTAVLFDKILRGQRGGFCFELGALFGALLREMGFATAPCYARNVRAQEDFPPIMHRGEIVAIDGKRYYGDVGYGGPMAACAIPLEDDAEVLSCGQRFIMHKVECLEGLEGAVRGTVADVGEAAAVEAPAPAEAAEGVPADAGPWWRIDYQSASMGEPAPLMYVLDAAMKPQDFDPISFYCSAHPDSVFVRERLVNLRTPDGSKNIRNRTFTRVSAQGKEVRTLESVEELRAVLEREFGIVAPVATL